jgi:hypothetical protein
MANKEDYLDFLTSESYKNQIDIWFKAYNINYEKIDLFYDFLISLYNLIDETYLGVEYIKLQEDRLNHFTWCWDKIISNFENEKIYFKNRGYHYEYFWNLYDDAYYLAIINEEKIKIPEYFYKLFDFNHKKSRSEMDIFVEIYKQLDLNLKK